MGAEWNRENTTRENDCDRIRHYAAPHGAYLSPDVGQTRQPSRYDIAFIDEAHNLKAASQELLFEVIERSRDLQVRSNKDKDKDKDKDDKSEQPPAAAGSRTMLDHPGDGSAGRTYKRAEQAVFHSA